MTVRPRPPRLLVKTTIAVALVTVALLFLVVAVVTWSVREQVRQAVIDNLESTQRLFAALEARRQREMHAQAATLADSPTLKAALDTYAAYAPSATDATRVQLFATITNELEKLAGRVDADAIVLVDVRRTTLAAAGRLAERWQRGRPVSVVAGGEEAGSYNGVVHAGAHTFRVVSVPLVLTADTLIGTLYLATSLDDAYVRSLAALSRAQIAITAEGLLLASTLGSGRSRGFEAALAHARAPEGVFDLDGESYAYRKLFQVGDTSTYALGSIDAASGPATRRAMRHLALIAVGATLLALLGSFWLARQLTEPIGRLSASLEGMAAVPHADARLSLTGSSRELDTLTDTFNALMASVAAAEAQTQAAYTGAIRALAAALDARDPYTAGHSERVSVLSVAIGRALDLPGEDVEVLRLGALLHDIGKIGVPDHVLRKPGALTASEYDIIKQHPVLGARILRSVPFLSRHIPIVELHHERPDGRGYPHGLHDEDIPLAARIVHVADAYDAMTSARAYRGALPPREALRELWRCAGAQFHADIVSALAMVLRGATTETVVRASETVDV
ncbi:MAG: HD-GYP domain-containing protein [Vicinamibacterales bacterium]